MSAPKPSHKTPRTIEQATIMAERYAELQGQIDHIEGVRNRLISQANANADASAEALLTEQGQIREKLQPWWDKAKLELTKGKRKSVELGGCMIGSRSGRDSLGTAEDLGPAIAWLEKREWAGPLLRVTTTIDKAAVLKSIDGVYKKQLANLGFSRVPGAETFFVTRTEQGGTVAGAAA